MDPVTVIEGGVSDLPRDDVDTDQIIPARFMKRVERTGFGEFLFHDAKQAAGWDVPANPILVAGHNFGCGSSREHAPWALEDFGFRAVLAPSLADIFRSNCTKIGLLPIELPAAECRAVATAGEARIDLEAQTVTVGSDGEQVFSFAIGAETKHRLLNGLDDIGLTLGQVADIEAYEAGVGAPAWRAPTTLDLPDERVDPTVVA